MGLGSDVQDSGLFVYSLKGKLLAQHASPGYVDWIKKRDGDPSQLYVATTTGIVSYGLPVI